MTKAWAVHSLGDGQTVDVLGQAVQLRLFRNPGAAFSFATGTTWIFTLVATAASVAIVRLSRRLGSAWWALALGLLLGGAVGNLLDRLFREPAFAQGHVVDFIDLPRLFVLQRGGRLHHHRSRVAGPARLAGRAVRRHDTIRRRTTHPRADHADSDARRGQS